MNNHQNLAARQVWLAEDEAQRICFRAGHLVQGHNHHVCLASTGIWRSSRAAAGMLDNDLAFLLEKKATKADRSARGLSSQTAKPCGLNFM